MKRVHMFTVKSSDDSDEFYHAMNKQQFYQFLHERKHFEARSIADILRQMADIQQERSADQ